MELPVARSRAVRERLELELPERGFETEGAQDLDAATPDGDTGADLTESRRRLVKGDLEPARAAVAELGERTGKSEARDTATTAHDSRESGQRGQGDDERT